MMQDDRIAALLYRAGVAYGAGPFDWVSHYKLH